MKAHLVSFSLDCRVVLPEGATEEQIIEAAGEILAGWFKSHAHEFVENVKDDTEVPYGDSATDPNYKI
jgi:hypothetical protein